jgi:Protein of unknown function (DUF3015)
MKRLAVCALALGLAASGNALAQTKDTNNVGCGLGSVIFEGSSGVFPQVFAATTNGSFGTQTFGISSETLGCSPKGKVDIPDRRTVEFIGPNLNRLAQDMSRGEGETLAALADTMQIAPNDRGAFFATTQNNFERIISGDSVTAGEVALSLYEVLGEDPVLSRYVTS